MTCDNASNNDTMIEELDDLLTGYSSLNRTRCFAHILNLVAKALLKQFDVKTEDKTDLNSDERSLLEMATNIETEELTTVQEKGGDDDNDDGDDDVDVEWVDGIEALAHEERTNLEELIRPVKRTLVKVRYASYLVTCTKLAPSYASLHSRSFIRQPYSCQLGRPASRNWGCQSKSCRAMSRRDGIRHTTCCALP